MGITRSQMDTDSKEGFKSWFYDSFLKRNSGWGPSNIDFWLDENEKTHKQIRDILGGIRCSAVFELKSQQNPLKPSEVTDIYQRLKNLIPHYFADYGYDENVLLMPTINVGTHNAVRICKHINAYAVGVLAAQQKKELDKILVELGNLWGKARTSDITVEVTISTSPKSFALLGHYGPDSDSCFRQTSDKTFQKFTAGQSLNTFVLTIAAFNKNKNKYTNVARSLGWIDNGQVNIFNYYFSAGFSEGDGLSAITQMFSEVFNKELELIEGISIVQGSPETIYHNPYAHWSFVPKGQHGQVQYLVPNENKIRIFICPRCNRQTKNTLHWATIDGSFVCDRCCGEAYRCQLTEELTFQPLLEFIDKNDSEYLVHPKHAEFWPKCNHCNRLIASPVYQENMALCKDCFETFYSVCEICEQIVPDEELCEDGDIVICKRCVERGHIPFDEDTLEYLSATL